MPNVMTLCTTTTVCVLPNYDYSLSLLYIITKQIPFKTNTNKHNVLKHFITMCISHHLKPLMMNVT